MVSGGGSLGDQPVSQGLKAGGNFLLVSHTSRCIDSIF